LIEKFKLECHSSEYIEVL